MQRASARHLAQLCVCSWIACSWPHAVRADSADAPSISWVRGAGAEGCVSGPELSRQVEAQSGAAVLRALPRGELIIEGAVGRSERGFDVRIRLLDRADLVRGQRAFVAAVADCRLLDSLLVFVIALMIDPDAPLLPPELPAGITAETDAVLSALFGSEPLVPPLSLSTPAPGVAPPEAATGSMVPATNAAMRDAAGAPASSSSSPDHTSHMHVRIAGLTALGALPKLGAGLRATLGIPVASSWRIDVGGQLFFDNAVSTGAADLSLLLAEVGVCKQPEPFASAFELWICGQATGGILRAQVHLDSPNNPARPAVQIGAGSELVYRLSSVFSVRAALFVVAPLVRESFYVSAVGGRELAFRMWALTVSASLGIGVQF